MGSDKNRRWLRVAALALGFVGTWAFLVHGLPALRAVPAIAEVTEAVGASGIDAGAIWWSEVPATGISELQARDVANRR